MQLTGLTGLLRRSPVYQAPLARLRDGQTATIQVIRAARPHLLATLAGDWPGPIIYLTARGRQAYNVSEQLPVWLDERRPVHRFAEPTPMFYDRLPWDRGIIQARLETLAALMDVESHGAGQAPVVISSARALMQRTLPPAQFYQRTYTLEVGQRYPIDRLLQDWLRLGYEPVTMVTEPGMFSRRGGILDIYPIAAPAPVRIEYFDDEIDTLRGFDPSTQRSTGNLPRVTIIPAREALPAQAPQVARHLADWFQSHTTGDEAAVNTRSQDAQELAQAQAFPYLEHYLPYMVPNPVSLLDYAPPEALIVIDTPEEFFTRLDDLVHEAEHNRENNRKTDQLAPDHPTPYVPPETIQADLETRTTLHLDNQPPAAGESRLYSPGERYGGQMRLALNHIREACRSEQRVVVVTQQADRFAQLWNEQDPSGHVPRVTDLAEPPAPGTLVVVPGELSEGFTLHAGESALRLITDAELFNWSRPEPRRRPAARQARGRLPEADYADWKEGDYVVHIDYGIGCFRGMRSRTVEGSEREYLVVEYAGTDTVFVPIHQADRLTRYVGPDEAPPQLNRLGKPAEWTRTREKARQAAEEEARELLQIYAQRASTSGHAFQPDTPWQHELEASFPYVETEDQLRVLREIKRDMESTMPMDRLVCGDVGYGKTEVALRAAFKAVEDGKQVAVLVPTTVLAQQHYETFGRRMENFPIRLEMLSRFRTKGEHSRILTELASGQIDIIIGTHRILSDDVTVPNLGLVIIDEEQRFGVKHKEHFKKLRAQVDVLTLTATPIPRTLYMSLSGVRDISMIQTPPEERLPVITHVGPFDPRLARQAILRELDRGGQVFVIHNRIKTIETIRERFEELVPEASIVVGHGQMSGRQLEGVIADFTRGRYDILLSTSIIENGIDMPNVNTLIVDRADWFGMSQLYQLRGRVGRSAQQAYAYFFHAGGSRLTEEARARLETLAEHTDLGAGFQVSVRDLELRGAGDILSMRQTGHVTTVGLRLYTQLLQQAINRLKGEADGAPQPTYEQERIIIDLPLPAYIPEDWIPEMALRLQLYRRIGTLQNLPDLDAMRQELRDRFGQLPAAVEGLLYQIQIKLLAADIHATAVIKPRKHILVKLPWLTAVNRDALAARLGDDIAVSRTAVEIPYQAELWQERLLQIMEQLKDGLPEQVGI